VPVSSDLPDDMTVLEDETFTAEQIDAIGRREGDLFLDAAAGSGKTAVLVERFVQAVLQDAVDVGAILTITFTEKAAAEMRERIRARLHELGAPDAARATEGAFISTIHGFCARVLRAHALGAGIDPAFTVLDQLEAGRLADAAFEHALVGLAEAEPGAVELISAYGAWDLSGATQSLYGELRSRGERVPRLPSLPDAPDLERARGELAAAAEAAAAELGEVPEPSARVVEALERLARLRELLSERGPWPGEVGRLRLPGGNGAALSTPVCVEYGEALARFRAAAEHLWADRVVTLLDQLLAGFGAEFERLKRERSGLDFEDLELLSRDLLRSDLELRDRYRSRFERVMVDELQDTNAVQLELIELVSSDDLFTVGDAQQSIYGFRHADVELFERRGEILAQAGARATLRMNFRSRPEIVEVINRVFESQLGDRFAPLVAGRSAEPAEDPRVELHVADKGADWASEGLSAPWRIAEARALAERVQELVAGGAAPGEIVVLTRAATDMRAYERALEERGVPTYMVGGRGYWSHPQVLDMLSYLRALANPRDEEALYGVLGSPMVAASPDTLVLLGAAARERRRDPWWVLTDPGPALDEIAPDERGRLEAFVAWMAVERAATARHGVEELLERVLERTGYDLQVLAMPGGQRRLANIRKLMRLGREHLAAHGPDLRGFLDLVALRSASWRPDPDQGEAPVESEALDAVRLMTIHRAKGLEFEIVCVADLGRAPRWRSEVLRVGRDGRLGLRLARPGTGRREPALAYDELGEARREEEAAEERRLFYVAMTRARERLILSGAARLETWGGPGSGGAPISWLGPALVPDLADADGVADGVRFSVVRPSEETIEGPTVDPAAAPETDYPEPPIPAQERPGRSAPPVGALSYTSLAAYQRCGYRFYVERVLSVPGREAPGPPSPAPPGGAVLTPAERGTVVHALLERLDFRRPAVPQPAAIIAAAPREPSAEELEEIAGLVERFTGTELCRRLGRATGVRSEQRFAFPLGSALITGMLDVIASEPGGRTLIVDYKTDRLDGADPAAIVARQYETQRLTYALAALTARADRVDVVHVFLERPDEPVSVSFAAADARKLEQRLKAVAAGVLEGRYPVAEMPHRALCAGCPAEGGLCSWPLEMTRREAVDRLF
jgi:ATP-dependent exoDNAse (exonuclease V) beta subunit